MDINFIAYVQTIILYLQQKCIKDTAMKLHKYQIVNVGSIAGHMACSRNSIYCASKYAVTGMVEGLRQEMLTTPNVVLTNFYPYYINTGMFDGFNPLMGKIIPTMDQNYVADRMYQAIMAEEEEVYIHSFIYWFKLLTLFIPLYVKTRVFQYMVGAGMDTWVGRNKKD